MHEHIKNNIYIYLSSYIHIVEWRDIHIGVCVCMLHIYYTHIIHGPAVTFTSSRTPAERPSRCHAEANGDDPGEVDEAH